MDYQDLCSRIFSLDSRIRYVTVTDQMSNVLAGGMRPGLKPIEATMEEARKIDAQVAILDGIMRTWGESLGRARFALIQHEKANMLMIPFGNKHVELSMERSMPLEQIESILSLVEASNPKT